MVLFQNVLFHDVSMACINQAAAQYHVPAELIMAIIEVEGGKSGLAMLNSNGTYDLGIMQINTLWAPKFNAQGYTIKDIMYNNCENITVGTWILSQFLNSSHNLTTAIGNYHSHTPSYNYQYAQEVITAYKFIYRTLAPALSPLCKAKGQVC